MSDEKLSIQEFGMFLNSTIQTGIDNKIDPYIIIGVLETTKQTMINILTGVQDECE
jgi:hypothetical protein